MVIRYSDGSYVRGTIHRLAGANLRATVSGLEDAVEYRFLHGKWTSEMGAVVTFEFPSSAELLEIVPAMSCHPSPGCLDGGDCALRRIHGCPSGPVN